jgi:hypothetical protein
MSYQMIATHREAGSVERLCAALGVSVSGYYAWRSRPPSQHQATDAVLLRAIEVVYMKQAGVCMAVRASMRPYANRDCAVHRNGSPD